MIHYKIKVSGKVQGVFYRASAKEAAERLGVKGWVRNEEDGSVLIEAEGTEGQIKDFIGWCRQGPPFAQVEKVDIEEKPVSGYQNFFIQR